MSDKAAKVITDPRELAAEAKRIAMQGVGVLRKQITRGHDGERYVGIPEEYREGWVIVRVWTRLPNGQVPVDGQRRETSLRARQWQQCPDSVQRVGDVRPGASLYMWAPTELHEDETRARRDAILKRRDQYAHALVQRVQQIMSDRGTGAEAALTRADHPRVVSDMNDLPRS